MIFPNKHHPNRNPSSSKKPKIEHVDNLPLFFDLEREAMVKYCGSLHLKMGAKKRKFTSGALVDLVVGIGGNTC